MSILRIRNSGTLVIENGSLGIGPETIIASFDISGASYDGNSFLISEDSAPRELFFRPDGTRMFIVGAATDSLYQYTLSTPWDLSTASYDSVSFSVTTEETGPSGIFFRPDGTRMFICGDGADSMFQYTLSTPWDLSTASYDTVSLDLSTEDTSPQGIFIRADGTRFFIAGNGTDSIYQYTMSTPWDLSTASYDTVFVDTSTEDIVPVAVVFQSDGTRMIILGSENDLMYQYTLSTPWDVSTATFDSITFDISSEETGSGPGGLFFRADGLKFFMVGNGNDTVFRYST